MGESQESITVIAGLDDGAGATGTLEPASEIVERARAFVADVDSVIAKHGFSIKVTYHGAGPRLAICRAEDHADILVADDDDWLPASATSARSC